MQPPVDAPLRFSLESFGSPRSGGRRHAGVDLKYSERSDVVAPADGVVVRVQPNFYKDMAAVLLAIDGAVLVLGEVTDVVVAEGQAVTRGQPLARVGYAEDGVGRYILHFEVRAPGFSVYRPEDRWMDGQPAPANLIDPYPVLEAMAGETDPVFAPRGPSREALAWHVVSPLVAGAVASSVVGLGLLVVGRTVDSHERLHEQLQQLAVSALAAITLSAGLATASRL